MTQKTVVLATWGSYGDVHPFIAVALALKARGLHPVIATSLEYRGKVEGEGLAFHPVRPSFEQLGRDTCLTKDGFIAAYAKSPGWHLIETAVLPYLEEACDDLTAAASGADLVVACSISVAAMMAAERLGNPGASLADLATALLRSVEGESHAVEGWRKPQRPASTICGPDRSMKPPGAVHDHDC
jgi:UDP:flavonoid glycosyltransferase YjiC (YdhE family)